MPTDAGRAFLEQNGRRPDVTTTPSGLQYEVVKQGDGRKPKATDVVSVHYRGTFIDGTTFDASDRNGAPVSFPLNGVIGGWTEGVQLMSVGSIHNLYLPPDLAYGARGAPPTIAPNTTLIFEVELVGID
ncbi:MAG TPA: FKBP-type peptidyl-prolyl cis-trans isomerase [Gemmatimonadales bacterium]